MSINEPIPGQSPDPAPKPEAPKGEIKVEVRQPDVIHKMTSELAPERLLRIGSQESNDGLFKSLTSNVYVIQDSPRKDYTFGTSLFTSSEYEKRTDGGFYDDLRRKELNRLLSSRGYSVRENPHKGSYDITLNELVLSKNGKEWQLYFGHGNKEDSEYFSVKHAEDYRKGNPNATQEEADIWAFRSHTLALITLNSQYKSFVNEKVEEFNENLQSFATVYQDVINVLYEEAGVDHKQRNIILRPPVLNQDTITEIKSTEVLNPQLVTEKQATRERISFDDIAGQEEAVSEAKRLVLGINHPEIFERRGVKRPKGILFYGPPGTGKTMIAQAVANEANAEFFSVTAADIGTKWYGESENLMQKVFDRANEAARAGRKVILYFDEIDALVPNREGAHEATQKVISIILQNMDGMKANPNVTVIASTNRPEGIDAALRRPGRFDKLIYVGLPSVDGREKILKVHMERAKKAATASDELFSSDIDLAQIAQASEGMSGADLASLINLALEENTMKELEGQVWKPINNYDLVVTAKKFGILKERKKEFGFVPGNGNGQIRATTTK